MPRFLALSPVTATVLVIHSIVPWFLAIKALGLFPLPATALAAATTLVVHWIESPSFL